MDDLEYGFVDLDESEMKMLQDLGFDSEAGQMYLKSAIQSRGNIIGEKEFDEAIKREALEQEELLVLEKFQSPYCDAVDGEGFLNYPNISMIVYHRIVSMSMTDCGGY